MRPHVRTDLDPLDVGQLPPRNGMQLDYRTQPLGEQGERSYATRTLLQFALLALFVVIGVRAAAAYLAGAAERLQNVAMYFWFIALPVLGSLALIQYLRRRQLVAVLAWIVVPVVAWVLVHLATAAFRPLATYLLLFIPSVLYALWLADRMASHYMAWMIANPALESSTRQRWVTHCRSRVRLAWSELPGQLRAAGFLARTAIDPMVAEHVAYPLSFLALLALALVTLLPFGVFTAIGAPFYAGLFAVTVFLSLIVAAWLIWNHRAQPNRVSLRKTCWVCWCGLLSWIGYNSHHTPAPGVFQSPGGSARWRQTQLLIAMLAFALASVPLCSYFPVVLMLGGPGDWLTEIRAAVKSAPASPPAFTRDQVRAQLTDADELYFSHLDWAAKQSYLDERVRRRQTEAQDLASCQYQAALENQLLRTPERWFFLAAKRALVGRPWFSLAIFSSLALSLVAPPLLFFVVFWFVAGRVLLLYHTALEAPGACEQTRRAAPWDVRIARLQASPQAVAWQGGRVCERDHLWIGSAVLGDYPVLLNRRILADHAHIMGSTGSGKTALALAPLIAQLARSADSSIVIIDLKGDRALFAGARAEAQAAGLPFRWFTTELGHATYVFNPLLQAHRHRLSVYQRTDLLLGALGLKFGRIYGQSYFSDVQNHLLFRALQYDPDCNSFQWLFRLLQNRALYPDLSKKDRDNAAHIWMIVERLASFAALNAATPNDAPEMALGSAIQMADVFRRPQVLYFFLPSVLESVSVIEIARLALYSLLTAGLMAPPQRPQTYLIIDEFQQVATTNIEIILRQARSFNISTILANQVLADLKTVDGDLTEIIGGNTHFKQVFSAQDVFHQDRLIAGSGEAVYETYQRTFGARGDSIRISEETGPRLWRNDVIDFGHHPQRSLVQIDRSAGYTQFGGMSFIVKSGFHIPEQEYRRRAAEPWPAGSAETMTPMEPTLGRSPAKPDETVVEEERRAEAEATYEDMTLDDFLNQVRDEQAAEDSSPPEGGKSKKRRRRKRRSHDDTNDHQPRENSDEPASTL